MSQQTKGVKDNLSYFTKRATNFKVFLIESTALVLHYVA